MTADEIPQELLDILDRHAGKTHSRDGQVAATLAAILTRYDEIRDERGRGRDGPKMTITVGPPPPLEVRIVPVPVEWPMRERLR